MNKDEERSRSDALLCLCPRKFILRSNSKLFETCYTREQMLSVLEAELDVLPEEKAVILLAVR